MSPFMEEPEELHQVLATLPEKHQRAIQAAWKNIIDVSHENRRLLLKTLRTVRLWLYGIAVVLAVLGAWSVKLARDQAHAAYETRLDRCLSTNESHQNSVAYIASIAAKESAQHPAMRAQLRQSEQLDDKLFDVAFPYVKNCHAWASGHAPQHTTSITSTTTR